MQSYFVTTESGGDYYEAVEGLTGTALWQGLQTIISSGHLILTENQAKSTMYLVLDNYDGLVQCIYTGMWEAPGLPPDYTPDGYGYEHSYPQSWYNETGDNIPEQDWANYDLNHIFSANQSANASRGNTPFDYVTTISTTWGSGEHFSYRGENAFEETAFEVADKFKGNVARALFYFTVRYYDDDSGLTRFGIDMLPVLYQWHIQDPVDDNETTRNESIFAVQGNRNPFIDHPEFVSAIWGDLLLDSPQNLSATDIGSTNFTANWEPADRTIQYLFDVSTDLNFLTDGFVPSGKNRFVSGTSTSVIGLAEGTDYFFRVKAIDSETGVLSLHSQVFQVSTTGEVVYYWNFNQNEPSSGNWSQPILSQVGSGELSYTFENAISYVCTNINGVGAETNGYSFVPQGGTGNVNNGKYLELNVSSTGYQNLKLLYATRRTSTGFTTHEIQYTIDGANWQSKETFDITAYENDWTANQVVIADFSSLPLTDDNADFAIRIVLDGALGTTGNNRFDNIQIAGEEYLGTLPSPENIAVSVDNGVVTITWDAVVSATSYLIEDSSEPDGSYSTIETVEELFWSGSVSANRRFYRVIAE
jgi:hypothetical protein